jgi:hypothetical protein
MTVLAVERRVRAVRRIGPGEALEFAVLGAARAGDIDIERLTAVVQQVGDTCWHPAEAVVLGCVEALLAAGHLEAVEVRRAALPPAVRATEAGRRHLRSLLCADAGDPGDAVFRTAMLLKVAFLDALEPAARWSAVDALAAAVEAARQRHEAAVADCPLRSPGLTVALGHEARRLAGDLAWLHALRTALAERIGA